MSEASEERRGITLLTGAGFTKNFGGFLAGEMWAAILNHPQLRSTPLRQRMLNSQSLNFEEIYADVQDDPGVSDELKTVLTEAVFFLEMDLGWPDSPISKPTQFLIGFFKKILLAHRESLFLFTRTRTNFWRATGPKSCTWKPASNGLCSNSRQVALNHLRDQRVKSKASFPIRRRLSTGKVLLSLPRTRLTT